MMFDFISERSLGRVCTNILTTLYERTAMCYRKKIETGVWFCGRNVDKVFSPNIGARPDLQNLIAAGVD